MNVLIGMVIMVIIVPLFVGITVYLKSHEENEN